MGSKTVFKALSILDVFTAENPSWGLRDIAREVDLSHTVVHRILKTFEEKGYIFQNPDTQKYELGIKFIELGNVVKENLQIYELINPIMKSIAVETGESVVLTIADNNEGLFVKIVESEQSVRFAESVGKRSPLFVGASHKVILAYFPTEIQLQIINTGLETHPDHIVSREDILKTIELIRTQGWFYTASETYKDVAAIAIPLFDKRQNVLGSLSVAAPVFRLTEERAMEMLPVLKENQNKINEIFSKIIFPSRRNHEIKELTI